MTLPMSQAMILVMAAGAGSRRDCLGYRLGQGNQGEAQAEAEQAHGVNDFPSDSFGTFALHFSLRRLPRSVAEQFAGLRQIGVGKQANNAEHGANRDDDTSITLQRSTHTVSHEINRLWRILLRETTTILKRNQIANMIIQELCNEKQFNLKLIIVYVECLALENQQAAWFDEWNAKIRNQGGLMAVMIGVDGSIMTWFVGLSAVLKFYMAKLLELEVCFREGFPYLMKVGRIAPILFFRR